MQATEQSLTRAASSEFLTVQKYASTVAQKHKDRTPGSAAVNSANVAAGLSTRKVAGTSAPASSQRSEGGGEGWDSESLGHTEASVRCEGVASRTDSEETRARNVLRSAPGTDSAGGVGELGGDGSECLSTTIRKAMQPGTGGSRSILRSESTRGAGDQRVSALNKTPSTRQFLAVLNRVPSAGKAGGEEGLRRRGSDGQYDAFGARLLVGRCELGEGATREERVAWVVQTGQRLQGFGVLKSVEPRWDAGVAAEKEALDKVGFLFDAYRTDQWHYELIEMARKSVPFVPLLALTLSSLFLLFLLLCASASL